MNIKASYPLVILFFGFFLCQAHAQVNQAVIQASRPLYEGTDVQRAYQLGNEIVVEYLGVDFLDPEQDDRDPVPSAPFALEGPTILITSPRETFYQLPFDLQGPQGPIQFESSLPPLPAGAKLLGELDADGVWQTTNEWTFDPDASPMVESPEYGPLNAQYYPWIFWEEESGWFYVFESGVFGGYNTYWLYSFADRDWFYSSKATPTRLYSSANRAWFDR